jgi:hypothetical protein
MPWKLLLHIYATTQYFSHSFHCKSTNIKFVLKQCARIRLRRDFHHITVNLCFILTGESNVFEKSLVAQT